MFKHKRSSTLASLRPVRSGSLSSLPARTLTLQSTANSGATTPTLEKTLHATIAPLETTVEEPLFHDDFLSDMSSGTHTPEYVSPAEHLPAIHPFFSPGLETELAEEDELTLEELASRVSILDSDVATTVFIARAGRPKIVDVSPPASIRRRPASMAIYTTTTTTTTTSSAGRFEAPARSSSYFVHAHQLRRSRSSSMSSRGRSGSDSDAGTAYSSASTYSSVGMSPSSERPSREVDTVPAEVIKSVQTFPVPPSNVPSHRKMLSSSAPRYLRDKVEATRGSEESASRSSSGRSSHRSSMSFDRNALSEAARKASRFPVPITRRAAGWFQRS